MWGVRVGERMGVPLKSTPPPLKPLLKWAGGKRWLVPLLREIWTPYRTRTLVEPFTGGMAVALGLSPKHALLNDANASLINFYRQIQQGFEVRGGLKNESDFYYRKRAQFNAMIKEGEHLTATAARLFYFLMKTGYNGLCRFNRKGEFNVPFGQHKTIHYQTDFRAYQSVLAPWQFFQTDFQALALHGKEFLYVDPPYDATFTKYQGAGFAWNDQVRLADWLSKHRGPVVASNQATARILELYQDHGFTVFSLPAPRRIACNGDRRQALEMLALKEVKSKSMQTVRALLLQHNK